jgi:hypothetical protein
MSFMYKSLILQYINRNWNKLHPLDYVLLGVVGGSLLFALFLLFRRLYRLMTGKQRDLCIMPSASSASERRILFRQFTAEREILQRQVSRLSESFAMVRDMYREKRATAATLEDLSDRLFNYTISLRRTIMQMAAAIYALSAFDRLKTLVRIYAQAGVDNPLSDAQSVQELAGKLETVRKQVIEPVLSGQNLNVPDPQKFFGQFTVPGPEEASIEVFDTKIEDLYNSMKSLVERTVK